MPNPDGGGLGARRGLFWGFFVGMLILDQLVKAWVRANLALGGTRNWPWTGVLELRRENNSGIAYGLLGGKGVFLTPVAIAIAAGSIVYIYRHPKESRWNHAAFGLLASGALGNLYDRLFLDGQVTDMFWVRVFDFPIFNVADSCITVATVMLMIGWWREAAVKPTVLAKEEPSPNA